MAFRYPLAAIAGYLAFVVLIRGWIAISRGDWDTGGGDLPNPLDALDMVDTGGRAAGRAAQAAKEFAGGHSGGGGGGADWMPEPVEKVTPVREASSAASKAGDGWGISIDLDDGSSSSCSRSSRHLAASCASGT